MKKLRFREVNKLLKLTQNIVEPGIWNQDLSESTTYVLIKFTLLSLPRTIYLSIYHLSIYLSIIYPSIIYPSSIIYLFIYLSSIYPSSIIYHLSIIYLSIYHLSIYHLSIHHLSSIYPSIIYLSIHLSGDGSEISNFSQPQIAFLLQWAPFRELVMKANILHVFYPRKWQWETGSWFSRERLIIE